jgi:hypothetical protein
MRANPARLARMREALRGRPGSGLRRLAVAAEVIEALVGLGEAVAEAAGRGTTYRPSAGGPAARPEAGS